ncbi:MAG: solute carrier family 23 protein [Syntrophales bacterium]|nr:solute carrier family 23 protein [Syntrophales bacterium]
MTRRKKPANLIYDVDENPGMGALILLGFQHICVLTIAFVTPVLIIDAIGGKTEDARHLISMAMIVTGAATIIQGLKRGPVGSGYLCPLVNGPAFLSASILAGKTGGLSLIFGMTFIGGLFEAAFSRLVSRLRSVFPSEVTGTIVAMVGIEVIPFGVKRFFGVDALHPVLNPTAVLVAVITLCVMVGLTVWGKGKFRLYSVLIGMLTGYAAALALGMFGREQADIVVASQWFSVPAFGFYGMSFSAVLIIPFVVAALSSALKTMGDLSTCQKINDASWKRPDMKSISKGILACATGNILSGLTGALGQSPSSSNIGLSIATGATSRTIAYATGTLLIVLAFLPKIASFFVIMPTPVMGASLVFAASFMVIAGIQIMTSRMIDVRKTFVIGTAIVFGLSVDFIPGLYADIPDAIQPFFQSSLSLATVTAIVLNLFMRIGISKTASIELMPGTDSSEKIFAFMQRQGGLWGAMPDVISRAASSVNEVLESITSASISRGPLKVDLSFDEFNVEVEITYKGEPLVFPETRPSDEELLESPENLARLSGFIIRMNTDRVEWDLKDGLCRVRLHYDH